MSRDYFLYIEDIYNSCEKILTYTENSTLDLFRDDSMKYDAVMHNLMIIGEAIKHIPDELKERFTEIDWRALKTLRNMVAHEYFGIKKDQIWNFIHDKIPQLRDQMKSILDRENDHPDLQGKV